MEKEYKDMMDKWETPEELLEEDSKKIEELIDTLMPKGYSLFFAVGSKTNHTFAINGNYQAIVFTLMCAMLKDKDYFDIMREAVECYSTLYLQRKTDKKNVN